MDIKKLAQDWAAVPQVSDVHVSGDGRLAFFCVSGPHEVGEVYAVATDGASRAVQQTWGVDHHQIRDVSQDGSVVVLAQSTHGSAHDHLMILDRRVGNKLRLLTPKQQSHYVCGGRLTRDERAVIFVADYEYDTGAVVAGAVVWWQDITTGARRCLARMAGFIDRAPSLSPSGQQVLLQVNDGAPGGRQFWLVNLDGTGLRQILCFGAQNNTRGEWLDEGRIAFVTDLEGRDRLGVLQVATGGVTWAAEEPDLCPHEVVTGPKAWVCVAHHKGQTVVQGGGFVNRSGRRSLVPRAAMPDGGWIAEAYDSDAPHALMRVAPDGTCTPLWPTAAFAPQEVGRRGHGRQDQAGHDQGGHDQGRRHRAGQRFWWTTEDGLPCQGWLYTPEGPSKGFICHVHGGPAWHSEDWVNPMIGFWVQAGYTVLDPNYRGSTGFGHVWREAVKADGWGGREQGDIRAGIVACVAQGHAKPGRIAVAGTAFGGFSSWFAITRFADLVTAAIPVGGMYRLDIDDHQTGAPHGRDRCRAMMGGTLQEPPAKYAGASPGNFHRDIKGQVLVVHGLADSHVRAEHAHLAVRELTAAGIAHEVLLFGDEGHGILRRSNLAQYLARTVAFLERAFAEVT